MLKVIPKTVVKLMLFLLLLSLTSCNNSTASHLQKLVVKTVTLPSGSKLKTYIADTDSDQKKGLSTILPEDFSDNEAMLFTGDRMHIRQFWMPETHFNLDIIFMNADYYILDIHRNVKHYKKREPRRNVPLSKQVYSQHVLELKASSPLAKEIQPGMILEIK
jgi:uncharacterized membrane protein (UPF0127 family)